MHSIQTKGLTPNKYYDPADEKYINMDHIAHFFGCQLDQSLWGNPSFERCWLMQELLNAIGMCMESMPNNAFEDMYRCLHFDDDWDEDTGMNGMRFMGIKK